MPPKTRLLLAKNPNLKNANLSTALALKSRVLKGKGKAAGKAATWNPRN